LIANGSVGCGLGVPGTTVEAALGTLEDALGRLEDAVCTALQAVAMTANAMSGMACLRSVRLRETDGIPTSSLAIRRSLRAPALVIRSRTVGG
jgi:hypothetical protein